MANLGIETTKLSDKLFQNRVSRFMNHSTIIYLRWIAEIRSNKELQLEFILFLFELLLFFPLTLSVGHIVEVILQ